jgi:hypothetical protein
LTDGKADVLIVTKKLGGAAWAAREPKAIRRKTASFLGLNKQVNE